MFFWSKLSACAARVALQTAVWQTLELSEIVWNGENSYQKILFFWVFLFCFDNDVDDDVVDGVDDVVGGLRVGDLGFLRAQKREARTPLGVRQYSAFPTADNYTESGDCVDKVGQSPEEKL
jgi:hypothetical protein